MTRFEDIEEFNLSKEIVEKLKNPEFLRKELSKGKTFQEIFSYNEETMAKFYETASNLYHRQMYKESSDAFFFLTNLNPNVYGYWLGLGMSEQLNDDPSSALIAYHMATLTDPKNPLPYYHSASCYKMLHDDHSAKEALEQVLKIANDLPEFALIKEQAISLKKTFK